MYANLGLLLLAAPILLKCVNSMHILNLVFTLKISQEEASLISWNLKMMCMVNLKRQNWEHLKKWDV